MDRKAVIECMAKEVYVAMRYKREGEVPNWVENGNSFAQEVARRRAESALTAAITALEEAGMVVVPTEPSEQAVLNGYYVYGQSLYGSPQQGHGEVAADIYRAMIAAKE